MQDIWAGRRELLNEAIARSLSALEFSHGQLVREQVEASDRDETQTAALACLSAAEAAGGPAEAAIPAAVALTLISQMGMVFVGLENSRGGASLSTAWGMPRSLNAGDALFATAQESLLAFPDEITAENRLRAASILDNGSRALVEALLVLGEEHDPAAASQRALLPAAMALGGVFGGGDDRVRERLQGLGEEWNALPPEELSIRLAGDPKRWLET